MPGPEQTKPSSLEFFTPKEVAEIFKVREITVRLWLRRKLIRGVKIGHTWRIPRSAIEEFENPPKE